ncbi:MAG: thiamine-phosphate kinase [Terracidiphilus sp.]|jgi:thiamine-monophosphate kinase
MPRKYLNSGTGQGELALLRRIRERASQITTQSLRLGIGDDCALLSLRPGEELAITTDLSIEGRHFRRDWHQPESIGHRALARGLSDLAAMGARPIAAFLSLGLPRELAQSSNGRLPWVQRFLDGLLALGLANKIPLAGGDLSESPIPIADIVLTGAVPRGRALLRSGARPGHLIYVTGSLGRAAAGLARLADLAKSSGARARGSGPPRVPKSLAAQLAPHLFPQPRIAQGLLLQRRNIASAAIDLSDGLSTDLAHICEESCVGAEVDADLLPIHPGANLALALDGGEDYELLFTAPAATRIPRTIAGIPITCIGHMIKVRGRTPAVVLLTPQGPRPLEPQGWQHFS